MNTTPGVHVKEILPTDTKPQHSPTPWVAREFAQDIEISAPGFREVALVRRIYPIGGECPTACRVEQIANAAHIVKCVNAHDELVDLLRRALDYVCDAASDYDPDSSAGPLAQQIRAALALAKGTP